MRQKNWHQILINAILTSALPISVILTILAFRFRNLTESIYSQKIYPQILSIFAYLNRVPFAVAELGALIVFCVVIVICTAIILKSNRRIMILSLWFFRFFGWSVFLFLTLWGLNYARPTLRERAALNPQNIETTAILNASKETAVVTANLFKALHFQHTPTKLPYSFRMLEMEVEKAYRRLEILGKAIDFQPTPAKPVKTSILLSYLGIAGLYFPFTSEPLINVHQPDVAIPIALAHEKAHQRGITDEGEANFAAFLACSNKDSPLYVRYSAYLFATQHLLAESSRHFSYEEISNIHNLMGRGPINDLAAIREFWSRYEGPARTVAQATNDRYLQTMQVAKGIKSYGTVVEMLVALHQRGKLVYD